MPDLSYLSHIELDETGLPAPTPEVEHERRIAIFDLLEENVFGLSDQPGKNLPEGPYRLLLGIRDRRLVFDIRTEDDGIAAVFHLSLSPLRQVIRDYFQICESYFDAVRSMPPAQIEAIDMGRRGIHDEGSFQLQERLNGKVVMDKPTARRLFTLVCVLHFKG